MAVLTLEAAAKRYLIRCLLAALGIAAWLALLMAAVDPYRAFDAPALAGLTALKPRAAQQEDLTKSRIIGRLRPRTLLLGNSRVEEGLNPQSPLWPDSWRPVVNASEAGATLGTALCRLDDAVAGGRLARVVVAIDFPDFMKKTDPEPAAGQPRGKQCFVAAPWRWMISINGVTDSILTLLGQDRATGPTIDQDGFNPGRDNLVNVERIGYAGVFTAKIASYRHDFAQHPVPSFEDPLSYAAFRHLQAIIDTAEAAKIPLVIFIHPYHAQFLNLLHDLGLSSSFEAWKRCTRTMVAAANSNRPHSVTLLDFSGYTDISTEAAPPRGGPDTRWYWEPGHYKSALGERIIQQIVALLSLGREADIDPARVVRRPK